jgi:tetratricopeptide (TPR) repeat protein
MMTRARAWTCLAVLVGLSPLLVLVPEYRRLRAGVPPEMVRAVALSDEGEALAHQGDLPSALATYEQALALFPDHSPTLLRLADVYLAWNDLEKADAYCRRAIAADPRSGEGYNTLGVIAAMQGDLPGAIAYFNKTLELIPDHAMARDNLARAKRQAASRTNGTHRAEE